MAKPVKPKTLKPKDGVSDAMPEAEAKEKKQNVPSKTDSSSAPKKGLTMFQTIILAVVMLVASVAGPAITMYFLGPVLLKPILEQVMPASPEGEEGAEGHGTEESAHGESGEHGEGGGHASAHAAPVIGLNLGLDDFTVNLKRLEGVKGNQFLRAKMSLSVEVPEEQNCHLQATHHNEHAESGGGGGHGGGAPAVDPMEACMETFNKSMAPFTPTLRDIINTALMKRDAQQLSTLEGQEDLKDDLALEMNSVLESHGYKVQRVNLQDFIIQR